MASLVVVEDEVEASDGSAPRVHRQSRLRFRRPATGVSGQESLSDSEESRLSPVRGPPGRGEGCSEAKDELEDEDGIDSMGEAGFVLIERLVVVVVVVSDSSDEVVAREDMVETEDSMSEWASVYVTVLISSSRGKRKDTRFSAGKSGRAEAILRGFGPLERMERTLWGCL